MPHDAHDSGLTNGHCFVVSPIGEPESEVRRRSDQLLTYIIKPAARECGLTAIRADEIAEPGGPAIVRHITQGQPAWKIGRW